MMPAAGDSHGADGGVMKFSQNQVDTMRQIFISGGGNGGGLAEQVDAKINIVDEEVEYAAAAFGGICQPLAPCGSSTAPAEQGRAHFTERSGFHALGGFAVRTDEAQNLPSHQQAATLAGSGEHFVGGGAIERH